MACNELSFTPPLLIQDHLEDVITDEQSRAVFVCNITTDSPHRYTYKWYKDGEHIENHQTRIRMSVNGVRIKLEISLVTVEDEGVYSIIVKEGSSTVFSHANLYVGTLNNAYCTNRNLINIIHPNLRYKVQKCLTNKTVLVGNPIELFEIFEDRAIGDYLWYKSNRLITNEMRVMILSDSRSSELTILHAQEIDTGIYHVVSKTDNGFFASFCTVVVTGIALNTTNCCKTIPYFFESLPDKVEKSEGEEIRLTCKAKYDSNTRIEWLKNGVILGYSEDIEKYCYNETITLRFLNPDTKDTGNYTVFLRNDVTCKSPYTSCFLIINAIPKDKLPVIDIIKPLNHSISCFGTSLLLSCTFDLREPQYYFVIWYIGQLRVERTNHRFNVFSNGGDFYLFINHIEPSMAGEMICELYRVEPSRKSCLINKTSAYLTIVPHPLIEEVIKINQTKSKQLLFKYPIKKLVIPCRNKMFENDTGSSSPVHQAHSSKSNLPGALLITYCRCNVDYFYLDVYDTENPLSEQNIVISQLGENAHSLTIECPMYRSADPARWYSIDFCDTSEFVTAGVSSSPQFDIINPPAEQIIQFRIRIVAPINDFCEVRLSIQPAIKDLQLKATDCGIQEMESFDFHYTKTGDIIGSGAFGTVMLVYDEKNTYYAAKTIKTVLSKKREVAHREYELLKSFKHPKIVELFQCYENESMFILLTEFLWGGELFERIAEEDHIQEVDVVIYVRQLCEGLEYLHRKRIVHLDIKPENIVCLNPNSTVIKIIDFGLARELRKDSPIRAIYGSRDYIAPEILNYETLTFGCDMWSFGIVTYLLLSGILPFTGDTWLERSANITRASFRYDDVAFKHISVMAKDFINRLLKRLPEERMTAVEALGHEWICGGPPNGARSGHMRRAQENLKSYLANYRARWQRAGNVMRAAHRLRTQAGTHQDSVAGSADEA